MATLRYGIYLRPDPRTCWIQAQISVALRQQFGLVSAAAFPPHATLVGNLRTDLHAEQIINLLNPIFESTQTFPVHNKGIERSKSAWLYNVDETPEGERNEALLAIAEAVIAAVKPHALPMTDHLVSDLDEYRFWGHLSLASHDLLVNPTLSDEVGEFIAALPLEPPATFEARYFSLFSFEADWQNEWWHSLTWKHLHSWRLQH